MVGSFDARSHSVLVALIVFGRSKPPELGTSPEPSNDSRRISEPTVPPSKRHQGWTNSRIAIFN